MSSLLATDETCRFLGFAAHELRTPLATQRALLELALSDPAPDLATWHEICEEALSACRQQELVLEACLTLARSRCEPRRCEPVDLAEAAADALHDQDLTGLEMFATLDPVWTTGDRRLVERLVANLVSNAARHNVAGGWIAVTTRSEPDAVCLTVANSGPFVPADQLERLFLPFQRFGRGGVGLGLAIVQAIADAHDAVIDVRAQAGGGLEIDVLFPVYA
jgi:signal transduction histidine kinase